MRLEHMGSRQLDQIAGRIGDTLQEMKLNQIGSPKSHRLLQEGVIDPIRALTAGPMSQLRSVLQTLAGAEHDGGCERRGRSTTARGSRDDDEENPGSGVAMGKLRGSVNQVAEVIKMEQKVLQDTEKARGHSYEGSLR